MFPGAGEAAIAASAMHLRIDALSPPDGVRLGVRIGFHHGPVVEREGDVFGDAVNLASRLCDLASKGQTITDIATANGLPAMLMTNLRRLFSIPVKGKEQEVELVEILWQVADDQMTAIISRPAAPGTGQTRLELEFGGARIEIGPQRRKVTIGRDPASDFRIHDTAVSRGHAMIERRRDHFVVIDHSSNGTFVTFEGRPEIKIHREELTLVGRGWIAFGQSRSEAPQAIEFRCAEAEV